MARPPKDIRTTRRADRGGRYSIMYIEEPGVWHLTQAYSVADAIAWAKRSRQRLLAAARPGLTLAPLVRDMFAPGSAWRARQVAKGHVITDKGYANRDGHVRNYIIPLFGQDDPRQLTRRYVDDRLLEAARGQLPPPEPRPPKGHVPRCAPLASATMAKVVYTLNLCLEDLVDRGLIEANPIEGLRPYSRRTEHPRGAIPIEDLDKLFPPSHGAAMRVWGSTMWVACMCLMHDTGMRPGEIRALTWDSVNLDERFLAVRKGIEAGTRAHSKGTKTNIVHAAYISSRTAQELKVWRAETAYAADADWIFTQAGASPVTPNGVIKAFRAGVKAARLDHPEWTPYWLRHSFVTHNLDVLDDREIESLAGHTNAQTNAIYRHPDDALILKRTKSIRDKLDKKREGL